MILCEKGIVHFDGERAQLLAEFSCIVLGLKEHFDDEEIQHYYDSGFESDGKQALGVMKRIMNRFKEEKQ